MKKPIVKYYIEDETYCIELNGIKVFLKYKDTKKFEWYNKNELNESGLEDIEIVEEGD